MFWGCRGCYTAMFKILDGRNVFFQWDLNQKLIVFDDTITEVHFCNKTDECALVCEVYENNGLRLVNVPNVLLQSDFRLKAWGYAADHTKQEYTFKVIARTKPADYVYTETEVKSFEALEAKIDAITGGVALPTKVSQLENDAGYIANDGQSLDLAAQALWLNGQTVDVHGSSITFGAAQNGVNFSGNVLKNVGTPTANADAVNKAYVDNKKLSEFLNDAGFIAPTNGGYNLDLSAYNLNLSGRNTSISGENVSITGLVEPTANADAVNKAYVDNITGNINTALEAIIAAQEAIIGGAA